MKSYKKVGIGEANIHNVISDSKHELKKVMEAVVVPVTGLFVDESKVAEVKGEEDSLGILGGNGKRGPKSKIDWENIDWEKQDVKIALEVGCSRERVRQKRGEMGVGKSLMWHKRQDSVKETLRGMETAGRTLKELGKEVGCKGSYVMQCLLGMGKDYKRIDRRLPLKYKWDEADWSGTDIEVAKALGVGNVGVVSQYRFRHGIWKRADKVAEAALVGARQGQ